jgi:hypothetical protein
MPKPATARMVSSLARDVEREIRDVLEATEPAATPCCARCRRGTPAYGALPCGMDLNCRCHGTLLPRPDRRHE